MADRLDERIDELYKIRDKVRQLTAQIKELNADFKQKHDDLIRTMDEVGTPTARGSLASVVITETTVPTIEDWGKVSEWVMENDAIYLLHRRISSGPWNELRDAGQNVPGVTPFTKRAISLTKLRD